MLALLLLAGLALAEETEQNMPQYTNNQMFSEPSYIYPAAEARSEQFAQAQPVQVQTGPWYTVPNEPYRTSVDPFGFGVSAGFGFDPQNLITWGLGAVILLLLISTGINLFKKVLPSLRSAIEGAGDARSLETMSSLAQMALTAMEKYEELNSMEDE